MATRLKERFRENVRHVMTKDGWTQSELADAIGCTQGFVSQVLNGRMTPGLDVVDKFASALQVPAETLLSEKIPA